MSDFASPTALSLALWVLPQASAAFRSAALARQNELTKPAGSLGRLEDIAVFLAGWSHDGTPRATRADALVFAGNHGVTARGVSPFPAAVTAQMVANFQAGGAAINALAGINGITLRIYALDLDQPTADITSAPAMSVAETTAALAAGANAVAADCDLLILGEMGIGNTTIAAALAARAFGGTGTDWVGPGTGHDAAGVALKAQVVDAALARHASTERTAFDALRTLGGRELAAMAGAIVTARQRRIPVLIDGFVVTAALAALALECPDITGHCIAAHVSGEPAHRQLLAKLGLVPLLDLGMRLGEGSGAAVALPVVRAACATHTQMATFAEAAVSGREG
jgi:nicotinate-nucleotide--dimethylbenzimidazole phosphoribosyltransferase